MAAAVTLADAGIPVTVYESGPVPGGRARVVTTEGRELDNGQHILIGAYTTLLGLMARVGVPGDALLRLPLDLCYADGFRLRGAAGLLWARRVPARERIGAAGMMLRLLWNGYRVPAGMTVAALLRRHGQDGALAHYIWRPLCVSALNTPPEIASAQVFANMLRDSIAGPRGASDLLMPRMDLSRLFPVPAGRFIEKLGGEIRTHATVRDLAALRAEHASVIVAVGAHQLKTLLPERAPAYEFQPIYTCYLQYPGRTSLPRPMLGFAHGLVQWAFDRAALTGEPGLVACVISAQGDHQQMTRQALAEACHRELNAAVGGLPDPLWTQIIAEKRATVACTPAMKALQPSTPLPGVHFAGDYTDLDYPPTLEAAVRSGVRAARAALEALRR
jgi:squalene-associated FAD-dependent desaturase